MVEDISGIGEVPYNVVRQYRLFRSADMEMMVSQEKDFKTWQEIPAGKTNAVTSRDSTQPPEGTRKKIPETTTFHPLWIKYHQERNFEEWGEDMFERVTAETALEEFGKESSALVDARPIDGILDSSFARKIFHEVCGDFSPSHSASLYTQIAIRSGLPVYFQRNQQCNIDVPPDCLWKDGR